MLEPASGTLDPELGGLLAAVRFAHPNATVPVLSALVEGEVWELQLSLDELVSLGAVEAVDDRYEPVWDHEVEFDDTAERHASLASILAIGAPRRLEHLIAAGRLPEVAEEALCLADGLERLGRTGEAIELLIQAVGAAEGAPGVAARLVRVVVDRNDLRDLSQSLAAVGQDEQASAVLKGWAAFKRGEAVVPPEVSDVELRTAVSTLGFRQAQEAGLEAQRAWVAREQPVPRDRLLVWRGLTAYRDHQYPEAVRLHLEAQSLRTGSAWLSASLNACSAMLAAGRLDDARELASEALGRAREVRHPVYEARAEWVLRSVLNRRGHDQPDAVLVQTVLDHPTPSAPLLLMNEAWCAIRGGQLDLARTAALGMKRSPGAVTSLLADAILAVADSTSPTVDFSGLPDNLALDVFAMLHVHGVLPPSLEQRARELAHLPPGVGSTGFFSTPQARAHILAAPFSGAKQ